MITVVTAKTNNIIFNRCLRASLKRQNVPYKLVFEDYSLPAPIARNKLLPEFDTKYIAFIHQDVRMLYPTWLKNAERWCDTLPDLGMAGVAGKSYGCRMTGWIIHYYNPKVRNPYFGKVYPAFYYGHKPFRKPQLSQTLDGQVQIIPLEVFKRIQYDPKITSECAVDYCLSVKWHLNLNAYALPLATWHAKGRGDHGYGKPFNQPRAKQINKVIKKKWKGRFNLIFSTLDISICPRCHAGGVCICAKPLSMSENIAYGKQVQVAGRYNHERAHKKGNYK